MGELSTVQPPWIHEENWFDAVTATPDTIRAALSSGDGAHLQKRFSAITLINTHGRAIKAIRAKKGWEVQIAQVGHRPHLWAVQKSSKLDGSRIELSWLSAFFKRPREYFTSQETESLMIEFLEGTSNPRSVGWVEIAWR